LLQVKEIGEAPPKRAGTVSQGFTLIPCVESAQRRFSDPVRQQSGETSPKGASLGRLASFSGAAAVLPAVISPKSREDMCLGSQWERKNLFYSTPCPLTPVFKTFPWEQSARFFFGLGDQTETGCRRTLEPRMSEWVASLSEAKASQGD